MMGKKSCRNDQQGFVLIAGLMLLVILAMVGAFAARTAILDLQIAGNERNYHANFSEADGGTQLAIELLEQNFSCPGGFPAEVISGSEENDDSLTGFVSVFDPTFYDIYNPANPAEVIAWPKDSANTTAPESTHIRMSGKSSLLPGGSLSIGSGYEGMGRGSATGGSAYDHTIESTRFGANSGQTTVRVEWRHINGLEGSCLY